MLSRMSRLFLCVILCGGGDAATTYQFDFTAVRGEFTDATVLDGMQIAEVVLYDAYGNPISVEAASSPSDGGSHLEHPSSAIDSDLWTKFYDGNFGKESLTTELWLDVPSGVEVGSYRLWTAGDHPRRAQCRDSIPCPF